jgi:plasmid stabilization system protein ParE
VSLSLQQSDDFWADLLKHVDWYREQAAPDIAKQFIDIVEATLENLTRTPGLGRQRFVDWTELAGIRSFRVKRPFSRLLIFYRYDSPDLQHCPPLCLSADARSFGKPSSA